MRCGEYIGLGKVQSLGMSWENVEGLIFRNGIGVMRELHSQLELINNLPRYILATQRKSLYYQVGGTGSVPGEN